MLISHTSSRDCSCGKKMTQHVRVRRACDTFSPSTHWSSLRNTIQVMLTPMQRADSSSMRICGRLCKYGRLFSGILSSQDAPQIITTVRYHNKDVLFQPDNPHLASPATNTHVLNANNEIPRCHLRTTVSPALAER